MAVLVSRFPESFSAQKNENSERSVYISLPEVLQYSSEYWLAATDRSRCPVSPPVFLLPPQLTSADCRTWLATRKRNNSKAKLEGWLSKDSNINAGTSAGAKTVSEARRGSGATRDWLQPTNCSDTQSVGSEKSPVLQSLLSQWNSVGAGSKPSSTQPNPWLSAPEKPNPMKRSADLSPWLLRTSVEATASTAPEASKVSRLSPWLCTLAQEAAPCTPYQEAAPSTPYQEAAPSTPFQEKEVEPNSPWLILPKEITDPVEALRRGFQEFLRTPLGADGSSSSSSSGFRLQPSSSSDSVDFWLRKTESSVLCIEDDSVLCIEDDLANWIRVDETNSEGSIVTLENDVDEEGDVEDMVLVGDLNQWLM